MPNLRRLVPRHLQGLKGLDLAIGIVLTPILIPLWILGWVARRIHSVQEWWWNS